MGSLKRDAIDGMPRQKRGGDFNLTPQMFQAITIHPKGERHAGKMPRKMCKRHRRRKLFFTQPCFAALLSRVLRPVASSRLFFEVLGGGFGSVSLVGPGQDS